MKFRDKTYRVFNKVSGRNVAYFKYKHEAIEWCKNKSPSNWDDIYSVLDPLIKTA